MSIHSEVLTEPNQAPVLGADMRRTLRARAHTLSPVIMIGDAGLSDAIIAETDRALTAHGLIKVRVLGDDRAARADFAQTLSERLQCSLVQTIGKLIVLWRPTADARATASRSRSTLNTPKKLAAVGKTSPRRKPRSLVAQDKPATPARARVPGLARRAGPGIRSARGALDTQAQPRLRTERAGGTAARAPSPATSHLRTASPARPPRSTRTLAAPARRRVTPAGPKRSAPPAPRTRAGRSGR